MLRCQLSLRGLNLINVLSEGEESNPFAVVIHVATTPGDQPKCIGRTETQRDLSPFWEQTINFDYALGTPMMLCVQVYDQMGQRQYFSMGSCYFDVADLLFAPGHCRAKNMEQGGILIAYLKKGTSMGEFRLRLKGVQLLDIEGAASKKCNAFYEIHQRTENEEGFITWERVYRSKTVLNNTFPAWPELIMDVAALGGGNLNHPLILIVFDHRKNGEHELIGEVQLSLNRIIDASTKGKYDPSLAIPLISKQSKSGPSPRPSHGRKHLKEQQQAQTDIARIMVLRARIVGATDASEVNLDLQHPIGTVNFLDYIIGGFDLNICFAIDFTASNRDPADPESLHFLDPEGGFNDYEKSIVALLDALSRFNTDKHYSLWGFGAKYGDEVHNVFQCGEKLMIPGLDGILQAYRSQFRSGITMSATGTVFTDVIISGAAHARRAARAAEKLRRRAYTVLIILTDDDPEDPEETMTVLDKVAQDPISVVVVGIGRNEFSGMSFVDDLRQTRKHRDNAQFVKFSRHSRHSQEFTSEACQELPQQISAYFSSKKIPPLKEKEISDDDILIMPAEDELDIAIRFDGDGRPLIAEGGLEHHDIFGQLESFEQ